jgi:hypothetical protein
LLGNLSINWIFMILAEGVVNNSDGILDFDGVLDFDGCS